MVSHVCLHLSIVERIMIRLSYSAQTILIHEDILICHHILHFCLLPFLWQFPPIFLWKLLSRFSNWKCFMRNIQIRYCIEKSTQEIMKPIIICMYHFAILHTCTWCWWHPQQSLSQPGRYQFPPLASPLWPKRRSLVSLGHWLRALRGCPYYVIRDRGEGSSRFITILHVLVFRLN